MKEESKKGHILLYIYVRSYINAKRNAKACFKSCLFGDEGTEENSSVRGAPESAVLTSPSRRAFLAQLSLA